ncbi:arylsulfatase [Cognatishimia sp. SS12]|uniref:arylsulfatase n=1 Tax=Cognatishimia sp. SS12 TaxID=2979465 RepID=UPI00232D358C|nr:arylsulfatase [Cognatishimia sp. SS12]MDC0739386.1 arylsulfatase [Cognatishimia sp. SS12]
MAGQQKAEPNARYGVIPSNRTRAPAGAPNILIIMTDDVGFAASSTFGGPVPSPTFDALAEDGLRYNGFHTTAMCSSTRAALLTGRNHHTVGTGSVVDIGYDEPGYDSIIPDSCAPFAKTLKKNGYSTAFIGKNHNTPDWELTAQGPFDRWPTGMGFDYFYGFHGGAADQNAPALVENTTLLDTPDDPDYFMDRDLADKSLEWLRTQRIAAPDAPFLLYLAPGTAHSPHRAPQDWIDRFKGQFDQGWDAMREEIFARQKMLGVIPPDTKLTPRPKEIPAWSSLDDQSKDVAARMMECFAAQLAYFEHQLGRIIKELKRTGQYDNTLILYIQGDNGASGEGKLEGSLANTLNPRPIPMSYMHSRLEDFGGPTTFQNYPTGWGWATNTPFQWTKQVASHFGGTRNGMVVTWPAGIKDRGGVRQQFSHVVDVASTLYEIIGIDVPEQVDGIDQSPLEGTSFAYSFDAPDAPSRHTFQYFEMVGNRAWYEDGWIASTTPGKLPWIMEPPPSVADYNWELYDLSRDYSQADDLAQEHPEKLQEMRAKFETYAAAHNINPVDNDLRPRMTRDLRPYVTNGRSEFEFFETKTRIPDQGFPDLKKRSWALDAEVTLTATPAEGVIINQGGFFGGWGLFCRQGQLRFIYKAGAFEFDIFEITAEGRLTEGTHHITAEITADDAAPGSGISVVLRVDGAVVGKGRAERTIPNIFPAEGIGIGRSFGTGLIEVKQVPDRFTGRVERLTIKLAPT